MSGRATSVHDRLLSQAKQRGEDFNQTLTRYVIERFLYRLGISSQRDRFLLKGALLFNLWFDAPLRPTKNVDFLGFGSAEAEDTPRDIREVCAVSVDDGLSFDGQAISVENIRDNTDYGGLRVKLIAYLGTARCPLQLDIGFGDAVTPGPSEVVYPTMLSDMPAPGLLAYPRETVIAEKLEAIVHLGIGNSRMKDYFDLYALSLVPEEIVNSAQVRAAVDATFKRRGTPVPVELPLGLTPEFANDHHKQIQWRAFLSRNRLTAPMLQEVIDQIVLRYGDALPKSGSSQ